MNTLLLYYIQILYLGTFLSLGYLLLQPVNRVCVMEAKIIVPRKYPYVVLLYPVLKENFDTMKTTFLGLAKMEYPKNKFRVVAIPNENDSETVASLKTLSKEFPFLEVMTIPPTSSPLWNVVWKAWDRNPGATWWHKGKCKGNKNLPPKKTRQMIFAFYTLQRELKNNPEFGNWLLNYIDADSVPCSKHFLAAVAGMRKYDVLQSTNIAGNLLQSYPASWCAFDHLNWDYNIYMHMSANGKHPFWVLGKGLFYKSNDIVQVGGFDPWVTIEDPDIGLRLWSQGKKLGIISEPLVEEVPITIGRCITQRKRWFCGFLQANFGQNKLKGMKFTDKFKAYINLVPVLSLLVNLIGLPIGLWTIYTVLFKGVRLPLGLTVISTFNIICYLLTMSILYQSAWRNIDQVVNSRYNKVRYMFRINPVFLYFYWVIWCISMYIGLYMFLGDGGLLWQRTEKIDANHLLVRQKLSKMQ